jgi:DNA replicative helicase MCM subunit Mcm2 (Cdc46/Mcm family)
VQLEELEVLDLQTLVSYISYARKYIQPQLSDEAAEELTRGYVEMRKRGNSPGSRKKVASLFHDALVLLNSEKPLIHFCLVDRS